MTDRQLMAVRRPFEAARMRMAGAQSVDFLHDELSNMLHHLYRLGELRADRWGISSKGKQFSTRVKVVPGALGAIWIRCYNTHDVFEVSRVGDAQSHTDLCTDTYTDLYGTLVWKHLDDMSFVNKPDDIDRYDDYKDHLQHKAVIDTIRHAFDGLAALP